MILSDANIFNNLFDSILIVDTDFNFLYANAQFYNLTELSERHLREKNMSVFLPIKDWLPYLSMSQETQVKTPSLAFKSVQVCVEKIQYLNTDSYFIYIRDVSVESGLQSKYRSEIKKKEAFIQRLDRKLFEVSFLLELSSILNLREEGTDVFHRAVELILRQFHFQRVVLITFEKNEQKIIASAGPKVEQIFWEKAVSVGPTYIFKVEPASKGKITNGCLLFESEIEPSSEDRELLASATAQSLARFEQEVLYFSSITDEKTKLFNSRYFQISIEQGIKRSDRRAENLGLLIIDIDHFKKVNDTYGHQVGDEVLIHVALLLKSITRDTDVLARYGGEEFCIIAENADSEGLKILMERIRHKIEMNPLISQELGSIKITVSIGSAIYPIHASNKEALFVKADQALYQSKNNGRNQSTISSPN